MKTCKSTPCTKMGWGSEYVTDKNSGLKECSGFGVEADVFTITQTLLHRVFLFRFFCLYLSSQGSRMRFTHTHPAFHGDGEVVSHWLADQLRLLPGHLREATRGR